MHLSIPYIIFYVFHNNRWDYPPPEFDTLCTESLVFRNSSCFLRFIIDNSEKICYTVGRASPLAAVNAII